MFNNGNVFLVPESILKPQAVTLTPTSVQLTWSPPQKPNGLISEYILERRLNNSQAIYTIMTFLPTATLAFVDESSDLSPYTTYQYRIKVVNGAGTGTSPWATVTTKSSSKLSPFYIAKDFDPSFCYANCY